LKLRCTSPLPSALKELAFAGGIQHGGRWARRTPLHVDEGHGAPVHRLAHIQMICWSFFQERGGADRITSMTANRSATCPQGAATALRGLEIQVLQRRRLGFTV